MTHKVIKRFKQGGSSKTVEDIYRLRPDLERMMLMDMRDAGYVPVLDISPVLRTRYNPTKDEFTWWLTIQAVFEGKERAWQIEGIADGKPIPRFTHPTKSEQSSSPSE